MTLKFLFSWVQQKDVPHENPSFSPCPGSHEAKANQCVLRLLPGLHFTWKTSMAAHAILSMAAAPCLPKPCARLARSCLMQQRTSAPVVGAAVADGFRLVRQLQARRCLKITHLPNRYFKAFLLIKS